MEERKHESIKNQGNHKVELYFNDMEMQSIQDTFAVIKKGGSKLEDKEAMMKLLVLKETQMYAVLNAFGVMSK